MAKINNELKGFQSIPRNLIFDSTISDRARFVYCFMASKPSNWDFFLEPMAKEIGYSVDTLRKYINELVNNGWLVKGEQENVNGKFGAIEYTIKASKVLSCTENTVSEKYRVGKNPSLHNIDCIDNRDNKEIKEEEEKEIDKSISKISQKSNKFGLDMSFVDESFMPILIEWLEYKKEKKQAYKQRGFVTLYKNLMQMSGGNADVARKIVEQSMQNNYAGLFPLRQTNNYSQQSLPTGMIITESAEERNKKYEQSMLDLWK